MDNQGKDGISDKEKAFQLGDIAQRVEPKFTWEDLALPQDKMSQLKDICSQAREISQGFDRKFSRDETDRVVLLRSLGYCAWKLGRIDEALDLMYQALNRARKHNDSYNAAITARNMMNVLIDQGDFVEAVNVGRENRDHALASSDEFMSFGVPRDD